MLRMEGDFTWHTPADVLELLAVLKGFGPDDKYRIVSGNTGTGVYKYDGPYAHYINVNQIAELQVDKAYSFRTMKKYASINHLRICSNF